MKDLKIDIATSDLELSTGLDLSVVEEDEQIQQNLAIRLRFFFGEWFLNTKVGIPYIEDILKKNPNPSTIEALLKEAISGTPGVYEILRYSQSINASARTLSVDFAVRTDYGIIRMTESLP